MVAGEAEYLRFKLRPSWIPKFYVIIAVNTVLALSLGMPRTIAGVSTCYFNKSSPGGI